jgi:hypothetical protein
VKKRKTPASRRRSRARRRRRPATTAPAPAAASLPAVATQVEQRGLPVAVELAAVARAPGAPRVKLERAMQILFAAYGGSDLDFSGLLLTGWARAPRDKQSRLTLAWQREQIRLSIEDILVEGVRTGGFRPELDAGAVAAVIVGAAEGCLLQAATDGGAVSGDRLVGSLLTLALTGA